MYVNTVDVVITIVVYNRHSWHLCALVDQEQASPAEVGVVVVAFRSDLVGAAAEKGQEGYDEYDSELHVVSGF